MSVPSGALDQEQAIPDAIAILTTALDGRLGLTIFEEMAADHKRCYGALVVLAGVLTAFLRDEDLLTDIALDWAGRRER